MSTSLIPPGPVSGTASGAKEALVANLWPFFISARPTSESVRKEEKHQCLYISLFESESKKRASFGRPVENKELYKLYDHYGRN